jgi:hypothetical protein
MCGVVRKKSKMCGSCAEKYSKKCGVVRDRESNSVVQCGILMAKFLTSLHSSYLGGIYNFMNSMQIKISF